MTPSLTAAAFVARWKAATQSERASYQQHFLDLCALIGHPSPAASDPTGERFAFEKPVTTLAGGKGFVDAWKRDHFILEYKGKGKSLSDAYQQARRYTDFLDNPPLIVTCDLERIEVHTVFTSYPKQLFRVTLDDLLANAPTPECALPPLTVLHALFFDPAALRPDRTIDRITEEAAATFGQLARSLTLRGNEPHTVAHFLIRLLFCLFAEDVGLLPTGLFTRLATNFQSQPERFARGIAQLFAAMAHGGEFGVETIKHFNGGLFDEAPALPLIESELAILAKAALLDWGSVEPSIFGTLFERSLDPAKRSQLGAHYTSREDIERIVRPVVLQPLLRRWAAVRTESETLLSERRALTDELTGRGANITPQERRTLQGRIERKSAELESHLQRFAASLAQVTVLDPACGSGNFLYVALRSLLDLERAVVLYAADVGLNLFVQRVGPEQMRGLEINDYAHELAPITVWIGYIQWLRENGFGQPEEPILRRFDMIRQQDALITRPVAPPERPLALSDRPAALHEWPAALPERPLASSEWPEASPEWPAAASDRPEAPPERPEGVSEWPEALPDRPEVVGNAPEVVTETQWPDADFIVGNPPFLGDKKMRAELGDTYTDQLRKVYSGRVDGGADLVTYWFEKARALIEAGKVQRAGFIATNSIRNGASRKVLDRIKASGDIFYAWSDREWVLAGAAVNVSMVAFDNGQETEKELDGKPVATINSDLTAKSADVTTAQALPENEGIVFLGMMKAGPFDLDEDVALEMLSQGGNPNGKPNSDVVRLRLGGQDVTGKPRGGYVVDFGVMSEDEASLYEAPFEHVRRVVKPIRDTNNRESTRKRYWRFGEARPALRAAIAGMERCIVTPEVAKHRIFIWMPTTTVPDHSCHVFARDDDYFFGVLHSRIHEVWSLKIGNSLEDRPRYNSSKTFGTFPLPWPPGTEPSEADSDTLRAIADAARRLVTLRDTWLRAEGLSDTERKKRTLTNLYNARPTWLDNAHKTLDAAVAAAYGWPPNLDDDTLLERLLALNRK